MPYVLGDGSVVKERSWFRFSIISEFVWAIVNGVGLFIQTLLDPKAPIKKGKFISGGGDRVGGSSGSGSSKSQLTKRGPNIKGFPTAAEAAACSTGS